MRRRGLVPQGPTVIGWPERREAHPHRICSQRQPRVRSDMTMSFDAASRIRLFLETIK
ncbi:hypothetical protein F8B43_0296 [Methylorubrum populi]|uniref:Uncharacterized protein n=1 Tax=Methylorubrum populi TaxID=223967 RepID=A0A833JAF8_9HYPH|nr:hypothetical protein F8B43_0296 [Methylorubrum populi]